MTNDKEFIKQKIEADILFHQRWQRITMVGYVALGVGGGALALIATILAALNLSLAAAIVSGGATIFIIAEKSLLLREKWRLHLTIRTALENLSLKVSGTLSAAHAQVEFTELRNKYATELPIEPRAAKGAISPVGPGGVPPQGG